MNRTSNGFGVIEVIVVIVVIAIVGLLGWKAWDVFSGKKSPEMTQTQQATANQAPTVTDATGLDQADATLNSTDIESTETAQLGTETSF